MFLIFMIFATMAASIRICGKSCVGCVVQICMICVIKMEFFFSY